MFSLLHENLLPQKYEGDITATNILSPEFKIANHLLIHLCKVKRLVIVLIQPAQNEKLKAYITLLDILFISFIKDSHSPFLLQCKVDSDDTTQTLVNTRERGGLWKVGTIFLECKKVCRSFTSQFQPVLKCLGLV